MGQSLIEIAQSLKDSDKKVQLIYAFNGTGKTRLSREFKELISPKEPTREREEENDVGIIYYNAFTEDLFYWDNDLDSDSDRKLKIQTNNFTNWVLQDQGQGPNVISTFQHYTNDKLNARFNERYTIKDENERDFDIPAYSEVSFSIERGNEEKIENIKISKGEESCFVWSVFYSLLEQVVEALNVAEPDERSTNQFDNLEYVFIDDPVSSLDDSHLIELAVDIAYLIRYSYFDWSNKTGLKFIITTHNPLFYNVLFNEFNNVDNRNGFKPKHSIKKRLEKLDDGTFLLVGQSNDSPFSYHLLLLHELERAIQSNEVQKYHFNFLRNILEKTSTFLGYNKWQDLLPNETTGARQAYYNRIINLSSHGKFAGEESSIIEENDKRVLRFLVNEVKNNYRFNSNNQITVGSE